MFLIRDPLARFVSAFNGRLREDRPRYHYPWRDGGERVAFAIFKTPNQLALALSSTDSERRDAANQGDARESAISTRRTPSGSGTRRRSGARLPDIFFIGFQDRLDADFEALRARSACLRRRSSLATRRRRTGRRPGSTTSSSDEARANLERWYAGDLAFVELCRELAPRVNAGA